MNTMRRFVFCSCAVPLILLAQNEIPVRARSRVLRAPSLTAAFPIGEPIVIPTPLGLPPVPIPPGNPPTADTVALGHKLFFDPILSRDRTISCASCHNSAGGLSDPRTVSIGVAGRSGTRQSMPVIDAAYHLTFFWDGRVLSLEEQATRPVQDLNEMAHSLAGVERKLAADPVYVSLFAQAWGAGEITYDMVAKSIASYERTLLSGNSPFDRYYYGGDKSAMNQSAIRGLALFLDATLEGPNCVSCHRIEKDYATFTEPRFHNTGVAWSVDKGAVIDPGRFAVTGEPKDLGSFKTPTLRNIALTAPYMHDGSMQTLEETVEFYFDGGRPNPHLSGAMPHHGVPRIPPSQREQAKEDLVEFMRALTGETPPGALPPQ